MELTGAKKAGWITLAASLGGVGLAAAAIYFLPAVGLTAAALATSILVVRLFALVAATAAGAAAVALRILDMPKYQHLTAVKNFFALFGVSFVVLSVVFAGIWGASFLLPPPPMVG